MRDGGGREAGGAAQAGISFRRGFMKIAEYFETASMLRNTHD
jgi:hypothetical protein